MYPFADGIEPEQVEALRQQHIGRLFLRAHRAFSDRAYEKLHALGHDGLGISHTNLLANLDMQGNQIKVLADRAGVTKQAMGHLVDDLEARGYVQREPDPADGRGTLVKFTVRGWQFLQDAYHVKQEIEAEYTEILGEARMKLLRETLETLLDGTNNPTREE